MRDKTKLMLEKVKKALITNEYLTAEMIGELCGFSAVSAYRVVKLLRLQGIGIIPTKKGYVLSEFANKKDDVYFIRKCYGRRASDLLALQTAMKDIKKRWRSVEDKNNLMFAIEHLTPNKNDQKKSNESLQHLITSSNYYGS